MNDMNLVIDGVKHQDEYGELGTFEVKFLQEDGKDLYVLYSRAADGIVIMIDRISNIHFFDDEEKFDEEAYDKARNNALEVYDFVIGDEDISDDIRKSKYFKAIDFVVNFYDSLTWPITEEEIEEAFKPYVGTNINDYKVTGSLEDLLD